MTRTPPALRLGVDSAGTQLLRPWAHCALACGLLLTMAGPMLGQEQLPLPDNVPPAGVTASKVLDEDLSAPLKIVLLFTVLTLAPAILMTATSFTRIIIVLSFVRRALSIQEMPPNQVLIGLALFLTVVVMNPVISEVNEKALQPYLADQITLQAAAGVAGKSLSGFLQSQTNDKDLVLMLDLVGLETPATPDDVPLHVLVPAFALSELRTAFQMGFLVYIPFLIVDLVVASVLLSMGMFMLPPVIISTPFKVLLFVLVDGWGLVIRSLFQSFQP